MDALQPSSAEAGTFLVEGYWPQSTLESFADVTARLDASLDALRRDGLVLCTVTATLVPQDEAAYWMVHAPSADLVEMACARAGVPVERIIAVIELRAEGVGRHPLSGDEPGASAGDAERR